MSDIKLEDLENLLHDKSKNTSEIVNLILNIGLLRNKLNNINNQSVYFQKAVIANKNKLGDLEKEYEELRILLNSLTVDEILSSIDEAENEYKIYAKRTPLGSMFMHKMFVGQLKNKIVHLKSLLHDKSKNNYYLTVDEYLNDLEKLFTDLIC